MSADSRLRIALPCTGLGRQHRGFEAVTRDLHAALRHAAGLELAVFGGGGDRRPDERSVWNLPRDARVTRAVAALTGRGPYFVEQATFFGGFLPALLTWRPHLVYFADLNFGNACWHWRRVSGQRFHLLYYNGGPTTRPYTRCDFVQQMTPAHHASALARGESPDRMFVLPHGVNVPAGMPQRDAARVAATRRAFGVPDGRPMLLSVGMLGATLKRMDVLVDAVQAMGADRPHLVMLGQQTPESDALRARARAGLGDGCWMGTWPRERMPEAYEAADAFALLSLDEGFGLVYLEALGAGLPCVAHDNANTRWLFGSQAHLGDTTTPSSAATLLRQALAEPPDEHRRASRRDWVRSHFSWDTLAPRYAEMLRACALGRRPAWSDA